MHYHGALMEVRYVCTGKEVRSLPISSTCRDHWENGQSRQRVITTLGRLDQMAEKGEIESLVRSLSRFSERTLLILSDKSKVSASAKKIGPALIFERLGKSWKLVLLSPLLWLIANFVFRRTCPVSDRTAPSLCFRFRPWL